MLKGKAVQGGWGRKRGLQASSAAGSGSTVESECLAGVAIPGTLAALSRTVLPVALSAPH